MTEEEATAICVLYDLNINNGGFVRKAGTYSELVRLALEAAAPKMKPLVSNVGHLIRFANFLGQDGFGNDPSERSACLLGVNKIFKTGWLDVPKPYALPLELKDAITEMRDTSKEWAPSLKIFGATYKDKGLLAILQARDALGKAGAPKLEVYELIQYCHDKTISFDKLVVSETGDRGQRLKNINRYRLKAPKLTAFVGISSWGPGDSDDNNAQTNLRNHMLKHVLDDDQKTHKPLTWTEEPALWWGKLGIQLALGDAKKHLPGIAMHIPDLFGPSANDQTTLPFDKVRAFLDKARVSMTKQFEDFMCDHYLKVYSDFALNAAQNFSEAKVTCARDYGHTVGISIGMAPDIFCFGRLDDAGTQLELSSCYITPDLNAKLNSGEELWLLTK